MSSHQRKRCGGAVDSRRARKRSRLLPSSAGGTFQAELIDLEESGTATFEPAGGEVIDLTGESSEPEVIALSDNESPVDRESQQEPHLSRASENSAELLARDDEEELRENDCARPAGPASPPAREDDDTEVQDREQSQQHPLGSISAGNSSELWSSDNEEEPRDNDGSINSSEWPDRFESPPTWEDDNTEDWEESQQYSLDSTSAENLLELLASNLQQEPRDIEFSINSSEWPDRFESPPTWEDDNTELREVYEQQRRNVALNSHEQVDGSGIGTGANDAHVADSAPAEQGAAEEQSARSDSVPCSAQPGVVIRCPICMDFYSEIIQSGRLIVATLCGHVFCSGCLPVALETASICPTCRVELSPEQYHPIYI